MRFAAAIAIPPSNFNDDFLSKMASFRTLQSHQLFPSSRGREEKRGLMNLVHPAEGPSVETFGTAAPTNG